MTNLSQSNSLFFINAAKLITAVEETREILQKMLDFYNDIFEREMTFYDIFEEPYISTEEYFKDMKDYSSCFDFSKEDIGKVVINSASSNTIPYPLFYMIEEKFDARRTHLG